MIRIRIRIRIGIRMRMKIRIRARTRINIRIRIGPRATDRATGHRGPWATERATGHRSGHGPPIEPPGHRLASNFKGNPPKSGPRATNAID